MVAGALTDSKSTRWPDPPIGPPRPLLASLGLVYRPLGEHAGQVLLVLGRGAEVAGRVEPVRRVLLRLFRLGAVVQGLLHCSRPHRRRPDFGKPDAPAAVHLL